MYYSYQDALSHNKLFNFVIGNRGGGKTFGFKRWAINDFIKHGNMFVYVRRYKTELKNNKSFFNDMIEFFPDHKFDVKGYKYYIDDKEAGVAIPLSVAITQKSVSFPKVNKICFDEFIIDKGFIHYMPNEVEAFLELYETIARTRDNVKVFFLGNAITTINPYFLYFNIIPDLSKRFTVKDLLQVEYFSNEEFIKMKKQTAFGRLISGTQYGDYAIENKFLKDSDDFIGEKSKKAVFDFMITFDNINMFFWFDSSNGFLYCVENGDKQTKRKFVLKSDDISPNYILIAKSNEFVKIIKHMFSYNSIIFQNQKMKSTFFDFMKFTGVT